MGLFKEEIREIQNKMLDAIMEHSMTLEETLIEAIAEAGYEPESYSGRGMFGNKCVGFIVPPREEYRAVAKITLAMGKDYNNVFDKACSDNMGRDNIIYFPRIPWTGVDKIECDSCGEELLSSEMKKCPETGLLLCLECFDNPQRGER